MPSKRENLEQLLDKNLSKTPDQARRENQSISSILQRFGGSSQQVKSPLPSSDTKETLVESQASEPMFDKPLENTLDTDKVENSIPSSTIPQTGIPTFGTPIISTPAASTLSPVIAKERKSKKSTQESSLFIDPNRGWLALPNDIVDRLLPTLSLPEQAVLLRMYRLSRGFGSDVCTIGYVTLGKLCNISRNTVKSAVKSLIVSGLIECLEQGVGADHSTYRVNLPAATVVKSGIPKSSTPQIGRQRPGIPLQGMPNIGTPTIGVVIDEATESKDGVPAIAGIPINGPIKEINNSKETIHTTQRVSSRYSLAECRQYAEHLKKTGQGITNPGGYATKIFRSGEADAFIDSFLNPSTPIDLNKCPACRGSNFLYIDPSNPDRGVKPCKHDELLNQSR